MNSSAILLTFLITLREGLEAAIIVSIVLAYLKKARQSQLNIWVYSAIAGGIIASAMVGVLLAQIFHGVETANQQYEHVIVPLLEGFLSLSAVIMITWMLSWMNYKARFLKAKQAKLEETVNAALKQDTKQVKNFSFKKPGWSIFSLIFVAVLREGFETVLFLIAYLQEGLVALLSALAGLGVAAGIGVMSFKWGIQINIRLFLQVMGIFLVLIVAGLVVTTLHEFDIALSALGQMNGNKADLCLYPGYGTTSSCILGPMVWNTANILPEDKFPGLLLSAMFGYTQNLYLLQALGYVLFLGTVGVHYFLGLLPEKDLRKKTAVTNKRYR